MKEEAAARLIALNQHFYQAFGDPFSATRSRLQPGIHRVLERIDRDDSILDLGCGNGSLARELARRGHAGFYLGLDSSPVLLAAARRGWAGEEPLFLTGDLTGPDWDREVLLRRGAGFRLATAFAVLHHIPGREMRLSLLERVHDLLAPAGRFIHSEWQFLNSGRLKARLQPWSEAGLREEDVDPGDYLLDWRSGGRGLRYAHHFDPAELESLARAAGFRVEDSFLSDGENDRLGLYQVWEKA